ncbi:HPr(Ser) kinase/phosphatase [Pseudoflavonifractor sp. DSM 107456]|uniref:HPr kinase/phosphorylase n=2 Tax=Pseudoflavonifractor TaxID=1017280 RepID=A0ABR9RBC8_9FIRM|nr:MULTISPECIES: HPr(Ser) kinase/phosphatase [Eubacteriales]MBC5729394.1 HPr(Ser) kinase/phosphatase [Pseudoflavonifractor hominis]MBE5055986.1 HPr(Ser) kinase/phosphatase [Pseudoflavonifractor gallinarum]MBT9684574.1 HPr(Ser) kinase/phosphatase [Pseudoflavonifractor sp. MCC625]
MSTPLSVKLGSLIDEFNLEVLRGAEGYRDLPISTEDINRPGLQLTGFFDYFDAQRIQVIGLVESTYLDGITSEERSIRFETLFQSEIPAFIIARGMEPFPECMEMAEKYNRTVLRSNETTSVLISAIVTSLHNHLAPRITRHGVLVEVYGEGVLLLGDSGVGKSETAIELVKRGHRLIADDAVEIRRVNNKSLMGTAPELIRHYIELRGIGVVDVRRIFGMIAIKEETEIDMVINLEPWREDAVYDRLGLDELYVDILDVKVPTITVPVKPGRNLAVIIEVAAMNNRHKKMGFNSALEFTKQIESHFDQAMGNF